MKIITAVFTLFSLLLLTNEQATAGELWWSISTEPDGQTRALMNHRDRSGILYPGEYKIRITLYDDDLKCTLRVGTKSSNTNLMKISGPLAVSIERVRLPGEVDCSTIGTITVSNPSTAAVPVLMTLSYGPALTKTVSMLIVQKVAIQSAVASPTHLAYNRGTRVTVNANISRKFLASELALRFMWRVREGKLCNVRPGQIERIYDTVEASTNWREGPYNDRYSNDLQTEILRGTLCGSGRTIVEIRGVRG